jgi:hypothetical protein
MPLLGSCSVDTTCCSIQQPTDDQELFWCTKCGQHVLKYEVAVHVLSGEICWVYGATPGNVPDFVIATQAFLSCLLSGEWVWADKGYAGNDSFLLPYPLPFGGVLSPVEQVWNHIHTCIHFEHVERVNRRLKIWRVWKLSGTMKWPYTLLHFCLARNRSFCS